MIGRKVFTILLCLSLAALPARVSAISISAGSNAEMTSEQVSAVTGDMQPMAQDCDMVGDHGTKNPGACNTFCNAVPLLPSTALILTGVVFADALFPSMDAVLHGIGLSPEPPPPKLV